MNIWRQMTTDLYELERLHMRRRLRPVDSAADARITVDSRQVLCLCSNNYLGLANHPMVKQAAIDAIEKWGVGSGASRLISGTTGPHAELETDLARFEGTESALVTSTGWQANACVIAATAEAGDLILADKLDHASILDAARASGATFRTYRHNDTDRLIALLDRHRASHKRCVIITDGLFSMDGDTADLASLVEIKNRFDAILIVDEAHATGVLGPTGRGTAEAEGVKDQVDIIVGTLSKALGSVGGFVAGPQALIDTIVNAGRAFIYTTAPPPAVCAAARAALHIVETQPELRQACLAKAANLRDKLNRAGFDTAGSTTQIIPIILGDADRTMALAQRCFDAGLLVGAIRPPTVAPGSARLRVSVMSEHADEDLARLVDVLQTA